jgi:hypothetical protein
MKPLMDAVINGDPVRSVIQTSRDRVHGADDILFVQDATPSLETVIKASLSMEYKIRLPEMKGGLSHETCMKTCQ